MRKYCIILMALVSVAVSSCDLNIEPTGSISTENALRSVDDAQKFRRDLYITVRDFLDSGAPVYLQELMADSFHGSITYGNRNGEYYKWEMRSTFGNVESLWQHSYYIVMLSNFLEAGLPGIEATTDADKSALQTILGECAFAKAYSMFRLVELYCPNYDASKASLDYGVMLSDATFPTPSVQASYPGRSSLADTYQYIEENLSKAESLLEGVSAEVGSSYITSDAVKAFKARVALTRKDYKTAASLASSLVDSGNYPLINNLDDFNDLWTNDSGKECIVQLWSDYQSVPASNCYGYVELQANGSYSPNYIPEKWIIDSYDTNDIRFRSWFFKTPCTFGNMTSTLYLCNKFPGNPELMPGATISTHVNKVKMFRIAEQYLIAAEAYANSDKPAEACKYLNALRASRIPGYAAKSYTGSELLAQIKRERAKELYGEGFRFKDLKRWEDGLTRSMAQDGNIVVSAGSETTELMVRSASDPFFLWPVPQAEIDSNPQIRSQQNPGY